MGTPTIWVSRTPRTPVGIEIILRPWIIANASTPLVLHLILVVIVNILILRRILNLIILIIQISPRGLRLASGHDECHRPGCGKRHLRAHKW